MSRGSWMSQFICFPLLLVGVLILGAMIPTFYDWSGADQSRPSPHFATAFYAVVGFMFVAMATLRWLPPRRLASDEGMDQVGETPKKFQFKLKTLIIFTSSIAIAIAGITSFQLITIIWLVALLLFFSAWFVMRDLGPRWKLIALLGCMYFPYAWVMVSNGSSGALGRQFIAALGLPGFVPSVFIGRYVGFRIDEHVWMLVLATGLELAIGVWMIRLGPRRAVAWVMVVSFLSLLGSCFLNALVRI